MAQIKLTKSAVDAVHLQAKGSRTTGYYDTRLPAQNHPSGPQGVRAPVPHER